MLWVTGSEVEVEVGPGNNTVECRAANTVGEGVASATVILAGGLQANLKLQYCNVLGVL